MVTRPHGIEIPYVVLGSGARPRMVFAHSLLASGTAGAEVFRPLVDAGWTVVAMDQRGHGRATPVTDPARLSLAELGHDLVAILDDLGWPTAWFGGGSLGAATSHRAVAAAPERAEGLGLIAPGIGREPSGRMAIFREVTTALRSGGVDAGVAAWRRTFGALGTADPTLDQHEEQLRAMPLDALTCLLETVPQWTMADELDALVGLDIPVLALAWDGDDIHPMALAEEIATLAPRGRLRRLDPVTDGLSPLDLFAVFARELEPLKPA